MGNPSMRIPYLVYFGFMLRYNPLRFGVLSFEVSISLLLYSTNVLPHTQQLAGQLLLIIFQLNKSRRFSTFWVLYLCHSHVSYTNVSFCERLNFVCQSTDLSSRITSFIRYMELAFFCPFNLKQ